MDTPHSRRRVSLVDYEYADLIDNQDKIRTLIDPSSSYTLAAAYALGRAVDKILLSTKNSVNCWKIFLRQSAANLYNLKSI